MVNHARINKSTSNGFNLQIIPTESTKKQNQTKKNKPPQKPEDPLTTQCRLQEEKM